MDIRQLIGIKKRGGALSRGQIYEFIQNLEDITPAQSAALLMAVCLKGMDNEETYHLTCAMHGSGEVLDTSFAGGIVADKHSTGGVSDSVTPVLVPALSAAGLKVIKLSGRGLSHTGGTIDKLESIPGFKAELSAEEIKRAVENSGAVICSQSASLAPADKILYALRDHTETVDSIPLIASSIMSKKLASGADVLLLDVKYGSGAFMKTAAQAVELARIMTEIGQRFGKKCGALITSMRQPLTPYVGCAPELISAVEVLKGNLRGTLYEITREIFARIIALSGTKTSPDAGRDVFDRQIRSGEAYRKFLQIVTSQGGDISFTDDYRRIFNPPLTKEIYCGGDGYVWDIDAELVGTAVLRLGGGREKPGDSIDRTAGLEYLIKLGDKVKKGDIVAKLYHNDAKKADFAAQAVQQSYTLKDSVPIAEKLIYAYISPDEEAFY